MKAGYYTKVYGLRCELSVNSRVISSFKTVRAVHVAGRISRNDVRRRNRGWFISKHPVKSRIQRDRDTRMRYQLHDADATAFRNGAALYSGIYYNYKPSARILHYKCIRYFLVKRKQSIITITVRTIIKYCYKMILTLGKRNT